MLKNNVRERLVLTENIANPKKFKRMEPMKLRAGRLIAAAVIVNLHCLMIGAHPSEMTFDEATYKPGKRRRCKRYCRSGRDNMSYRKY